MAPPRFDRRQKVPFLGTSKERAGTSESFLAPIFTERHTALALNFMRTLRQRCTFSICRPGTMPQEIHMHVAAASTRSSLIASQVCRSVTKHSFASHDGVALFYRHCSSVAPAPRGAVVLLHRDHEHSGRIEHLVDELALDDFEFFAWDARGHGCSPGTRGDAPSAATLVKDIDAFVRHIEDRHGAHPQRVHVVAQGRSALLAAAWVHDYAPPIASVVMAAAAFGSKDLASLAPSALRALHARRGNFFLRTYAKGVDLTQDLARRTSYEKDPLIAHSTSSRLLIGLQELAKRILAGAHAIEVPMQILIAGDDRVIQRRPQLEFYNALGSADKSFHTFDAFRHDILGERDRHLALDIVRRFIERRAEQEHASPHLNDQAERSKRSTWQHGRSGTSLQRARMAAARASMRTMGRLSDGARLGLSTGFDSTQFFDYVCRNRAQGTTLLGRMLDRRFLDDIQAQSLRMRKLHIEHAIRMAADRMRGAGLPVKIVGLSAGGGRVVLDAVQSLPALPDSVLLHDASPANAAQGNALIVERNLKAIARFVLAPSLDEQWLASIAPYSTIAIAPLHDGSSTAAAPIGQLLDGLALAVPRDGFLVYTSGPHRADWLWNASAGSADEDSTKQAQRHSLTLAQLHRQVAVAGFRKIDQWTDEWGGFSVSLAVRIRMP